MNLEKDNTLNQFKCCKIGKNVLIESTVLFDGNTENIEIGDNSIIGSFCNFRPVDHKIIIGKNVLIAQMVSIVPDSHIFKDTTKNIYDQGFYGGDIFIEDNVWIGCNVVILHNIKIGKGSVVAAGSVVVKSVPSYAVVAGNPAKIIKIYSVKSGHWINYKNIFTRAMFKLGII